MSDFSKYYELSEAEYTIKEVYLQAKLDNLPQADIVKMLEEVFKLAFTETQGIIITTENSVPYLEKYETKFLAAFEQLLETADEEFIGCVEFLITDDNRFELLCKIFYELKHDKANNSFREENLWLELFDEKALQYFWWPTDLEREKHLEKWFATPVEQRFTDDSLQHPWDFFAMVYAFENGEYELIACNKIGNTKARLVFEPFAYPYGGTGCMKALIEAFGFKVLREFPSFEEDSLTAKL